MTIRFWSTDKTSQALPLMMTVENDEPEASRKPSCDPGLGFSV